jgi:hypothetical protein
MKTIPIRNNERVSTKTVILAVARTPEPGKGITFTDMGKRLRLLDAIEKIPDDATSFTLEDADHYLLAHLVKVFQFQIADRELHEIIHDIVGADE